MTGFCPLESTCDAEPEMSVDKLSSSKSLNLIDEDPQFYGRPNAHIVSPQHYQRSPGRKCDKFTSARSILLDGEDMMMIVYDEVETIPSPRSDKYKYRKSSDLLRSGTSESPRSPAMRTRLSFWIIFGGIRVERIRWKGTGMEGYGYARDGR